MPHAVPSEERMRHFEHELDMSDAIQA